MAYIKELFNNCKSGSEKAYFLRRAIMEGLEDYLEPSEEDDYDAWDAYIEIGNAIKERRRISKEYVNDPARYNYKMTITITEYFDDGDKSKTYYSVDYPHLPILIHDIVENFDDDLVKNNCDHKIQITYFDSQFSIDRSAMGLIGISDWNCDSIAAMLYDAKYVSEEISKSYYDYYHNGKQIDIKHHLNEIEIFASDWLLPKDIALNLVFRMMTDTAIHDWWHYNLDIKNECIEMFADDITLDDHDAQKYWDKENCDFFMGMHEAFVDQNNIHK